jgi:hypothetical protein
VNRHGKEQQDADQLRDVFLSRSVVTGWSRLMATNADAPNRIGRNALSVVNPQWMLPAT